MPQGNPYSFFKTSVIMVFSAMMVLPWGMAWAGALDRTGAVGARDIGFGGDPDGLRLQDNLASKMMLEEMWINGSIEVIRPKFTYKDTRGHEVNSRSIAHPMPYVNYAQPVNEWMAAGVSLFTPYGLGTSFRNNPQQLGYDTATLISLTCTMPSVAFRLTDKLSLGVGVGLGFAQLKYEAPFDINRVPTPVYTENNGMGFGLNGGAGLVYEVTDGLTMGVNWMSPTKAHVDGKTNLSIGHFSLRDDFDAYVTFPSKLDYAVAWKVGEKTLIAADINFFNYSKTPNDLTLKLDRLGMKKGCDNG